MKVVPLQQSYDDPAVDFDAFWTLYVRHEARKDALKAWNQLTEADRVACLAGVVLWRSNYLARERRHVPLGATFIRGERWTDELPAVPGSSAACHAPAPVRAGERGVMPDKVRDLIRQLREKT